MSESTLRVAVIGCGRIATSEHVPSFLEASRLGLCSVVGVCDTNAERARETGERFGVPWFTSVDVLFEFSRPDVVSIATLPPSHHALTLRALRQGCHVLCEKPIAMNHGEADDMVRAAEEAKRLLSFCFEYRYWDEAVYLRRRIADGDFGHVHYIRTWGGGVHQLVADPSRRRWATSGGGVLTHWTIHNIDLALWLLGHPEPVSASAFGHQRVAGLPAAAFSSWLGDVGPGDPQIEDFAVGLVRLANGAAISVEANYLQAPSTRPEGWEIVADRATASISPIRVWIDHGDRWIDETPPAGVLAPCDYRMTRLFVGFLDRVRSGGPSPMTGAEVLRIQRLMDALYRSMALGREVDV